MVFEVTEIKMLGSGISRSLSLRLDAVSNEKTTASGFTKAAYTIHAVVPFSPEFATVQVGQQFKFERTETPLNERVVTNTLFPKGLKISELVCSYHLCDLGYAHNIGTMGCKNPNTKAQ